MEPAEEGTQPQAEAVDEIPLLPNELGLRPTIAAIKQARQALQGALSLAGSIIPALADLEAHERLVLELLKQHPFVRACDRKECVAANAHAAGDSSSSKATDVEILQVDCQLDTRSFRQWLKRPEAEQFRKIGKTVSDDGMYTVSALLRAFQPRGFSFFDFAEHSAERRRQAVVIRGFRKFTGMTAEVRTILQNTDANDFATTVTAVFSEGRRRRVGC